VIRKRPRLIGLVGSPYCGSTITGAILEATSGERTVAAGEVERLIRWQEPDSGQPNIPPCRRCGDSCPVWTPEARIKLNDDEELYPYLSELFYEAQSLVLSMKYPRFYDRFGHPDRAILLYRHPQAMAWSTLHHEGTAPEAYYPVWAQVHRETLAWIDAHADGVVMSYRGLMQSRRVQQLRPGWRTDHQLSGNRGDLAKSVEPPKYDDRWAREAQFPPPTPEALVLYEELNARSIYR